MKKWDRMANAYQICMAVGQLFIICRLYKNSDERKSNIFCGQNFFHENLEAKRADGRDDDSGGRREH
jgi:hypothetical protein